MRVKKRTNIRDDTSLQTGTHSVKGKFMGLLLCVCLVAASMPMEYFGVSVQAAEESNQLEFSQWSEEWDAEEGKKLQADPSKPAENPESADPSKPAENPESGDLAEGSESGVPDMGLDNGEKTESAGGENFGRTTAIEPGESEGVKGSVETAGAPSPQAEDTPEESNPSLHALAAPGTIQENTVWTGGTLGDGEVRVNPGVTLTIEGQISVSGNVMIQGGGKIVRGTADAYFEVESGSELVFGNILLDGNEISSGYSLIDVKSAGIVTLDDRCVIRNCVKDNRGTAIGGAAVSLEGGTLGCNDVVIENCRASNFGGAICARNASRVIIAKGTYQNNRTILPESERYAEWGGGFLYALRSSITIDDGRFVNNSATGGGGCIFHIGAAGRNLELKGGYFQGNTSSFPGYEGSGGMWCSSEQVDAGSLIIRGDVNFAGNGTASGTDGIYLDRQNAVTRKIQLNGTLENPVMVYLDAVEGFLIAKGFGYTLKQEDAEKILAVDVGTPGKQWYSVLDPAENEIYLSETNPGYGGFTLAQADFYSGGPGQKEIRTVVLSGAAGGRVSAPSLEPLEGFLAVGWEEDPDGFEGNISEGAEITLTEDKAYYGIYEKGITLDFHADGRNIPDMQTGTCRVKVQEEMTYRYPQFLIPPGPIRPGYTFSGWNTREDGTGQFYDPGSQEILEESMILYAIWDGGDEMLPDQPSTNPTPPGNEIPEWPPNAEGMARYRVEYYKQEPDGRGYRMEEGDIYYGIGPVDTVIKAQAKQFPGFTENTSHPSRIAEGTIREDGTLVLKLYYDRNSYTIYFDLNGGQGNAPKAQTISSGSLLAGESVPVRAGYNFKGWYLDKDGTSGNQWDFGRPPEDHGISESVVLYAKWADETAPVLGKATVTSGYKGLFHWMVQKKGLTITVPVKEEGSGIRQAKYTVIRKDGSREEFAVRIRTEQGEPIVQFTLDEDFHGTVVLTCTDNAGNISAEKILTLDGNGGVTENNGPEISVSVIGGGLSQGTTALKVTVRDEEDGIFGVTYKIDAQKETAAVLKEDENGDGKSLCFTVEISGGGTHILQVTAKDREGNTTIRQFTVELNGPGADSDTGSGGNFGGIGGGLNGSGSGSGTPGGGGSGSGNSGGGFGSISSGGPGYGNFGNGGPFGNTSGSGGPGEGSTPGGGGSGSGIPGGGTPGGGSGGSTPGGGSGGSTPGGSTPSGGEPGTGEVTHVEIYATISMIAGFTYLLLYFTPGIGNMTETKKELLVRRLVRWADGKGGLGRLLALAAIFLLLTYYHSIGKAVDEEWKTAAGKSIL